MAKTLNLIPDEGQPYNCMHLKNFLFPCPYCDAETLFFMLPTTVMNINELTQFVGMFCYNIRLHDVFQSSQCFYFYRFLA